MINHFYWLAPSSSKWNSLGISQVSQSVIESGQAVTDWCGFLPALDTWWGHHSFSAVVTAHHRHRSHRRLNFHLKCDWDVIVSSIGLLWGTTQLIPFYLCRLPSFSPRQSQERSSQRHPPTQSPPFCLSTCTTWLIWIPLFSCYLSSTVKNGYSAAPIALTDGLDIRVNTAVKNIKYFPGGVEVTAENLKTNNSTVTYKGEFLSRSFRDFL